MRHVLAFTANPGVDTSTWIARARDILERMSDTSGVTEFVSGNEIVLATSITAGDVITDGVSMLLSTGAVVRSGQLVDGRRLLDDDIGLDQLAPPFGACIRRAPNEPLSLATDACGFRHVAWTQGDGWAAAATSAVALGVLVRAELDEESLGSRAMCGWYLLDDRTAFRGVRIVPPSHACDLLGGRASIRAALPEARPRPSTGAVAAQVAEGARLVKESVRASLEAAPDATMELSGGLDSRVVLAAMPRDTRRGRCAITLGHADDPDVVIARALAQREGLEHHWVDLAGLDAITPDDACALVRAAALARDGGANPISKAANDWAERSLEQRPRFGGLGGEVARGFYYSWQRNRPSFGRSQVALLARYRIFAHDPASPAVLAPGFAAAMEAQTIDSLVADFEGYGDGWLRATDEFYLWSRMRRWVGSEYSAIAFTRVAMPPLFSPDVMAWSRGLAPKVKKDARALAGLVTVLDPALADVVTDSGFTPRQLSSPGVSLRAQRAAREAQRAARKVKGRLQRGTDRASNGVPALARAVITAWREDPSVRERLGHANFLAPDVYERITAPGARPSLGSLGFVTTVEALLWFREQIGVTG